MIFVGDDWAEAHHDIFICDEAGIRLAARRFPEGIAGIGGLHELIASHVDDPGEVHVGIETDRGLWVQSLVEAGYAVYAINPKSAWRYRDRHSVSGAKSDPGDAKMLAELVRTDRHNHRLIAGDSDLAEGVKVLARAHQKHPHHLQREHSLGPPQRPKPQDRRLTLTVLGCLSARLFSHRSRCRVR